ncbi:amidase 1-like [Quercus robur]|uniref:amidase 1-like n=1 Tax=Quercus robur TaxID=38942 RepID=UPI0021611457|nr:amidase 1-like [Quercus robur]
MEGIFICTRALGVFIHHIPRIWRDNVSALAIATNHVQGQNIYEFKTNHEEWVNLVKPKLGPDVSDRVLAAINTTHENIKILYKVRTEMWAALQNLLKVWFELFLYSKVVDHLIYFLMSIVNTIL